MLPPEILRKYDTTIGMEEITKTVVAIAATVAVVSIFDFISRGSGTGTTRWNDGSRYTPELDLVWDPYDSRYKTRDELQTDKRNRD